MSVYTRFQQKSEIALNFADADSPTSYLLAAACRRHTGQYNANHRVAVTASNSILAPSEST